VDPLFRRLVDSLRRGAADLAALEALGDPDPARASESLGQALRHPDLADTSMEWLPALLPTARPGYAARCLCELADRYRQTRHRALDLRQLPALPLLLGSSDFLARLLLRHPHWSEELAGKLPAAPETERPEADWTAIRMAKYKGLLRIAGRDLLERPFEESLSELSGLADRCLAAGLRRATLETESEPATLFALGKLGGEELNFSSDVDLLFIHEPPSAELDFERTRSLTRQVQTFKRQLEVASEDGFAYRVDLDLRPEGKQGVLVNSVDAALSYYETFGAAWERQALIRLRHVAGPREPAEFLTRQLTAFVFRRLIDPGAIRAVHNMKLRIESERRTAGGDLDMDVKEGPGGIRDVEFLVQALQLFYGGREPTLRTGNVLRALRSLEQLRLLPEAITYALRDAYLWLRRAEHSLQLVEERQTHRFPRDPAAQGALARRMGYRHAEVSAARSSMLDDWTRVRAQVREQFDALVLESEA
jgi:glutamate-ammonia-ligase adenylyltransferase